MRNVGIVIKYEIVSTIRRRSFWFFTFVFPVMILVFSFLPQVFVQRQMKDAQSTLVASATNQVAAYVDLAGVIRNVPPDLKANLKAYADEASAQAAMARGEIQTYYLIPADFLQTGRVVGVGEHASPVTGMAGSGQLEAALRYNLAGSGPEAAALVSPMQSFQVHSLTPATTAGAPEGAGRGRRGNNGEEFASFIIPFAVMFILFFVITMSAGFMLQSVTREKENRTAELLLLSVSPRELMLGKVVGLGLVALVQMLIWMGSGQLLLAAGVFAVATVASGMLGAGFFAWAIIFFILGYTLYAAALGALGALAPNMREGSQFTFVLLLPLLVPLWLNSVFSQDPNGVPATIMSLFPLTAPTAMVTRLAAGGVPTWQPFVAVVLLAVAAYLFVLIAARFFRADTLLSSASLDWRRVGSELRGR